MFLQDPYLTLQSYVLHTVYFVLVTLQFLCTLKADVKAAGLQSANKDEKTPLLQSKSKKSTKNIGPSPVRENTRIWKKL